MSYACDNHYRPEPGCKDCVETTQHYPNFRGLSKDLEARKAELILAVKDFNKTLPEGADRLCVEVHGAKCCCGTCWYERNPRK